MAHEGTEVSADSSELRLKSLRLAYAPYSFLVYVPHLLFSTIGFASAAIVLGSIHENFAYNCGRVWGWINCRMNFTKVKVSGREHADPKQSYIIMSNHMSYFDVLAILGHWGRQFRWVLKQEFRKVPLFGTGCVKAGHIFVDRSNRKAAIASMRKAKTQLKPGVSVMLFPEGTRSRTGQLGKFKKGGFMMALDMGLPILPVSISGSSKILPGGSLKLLPGTIRITVHEAIGTSAYGHKGRDRLMADVHAAIASGLTEAERSLGPSYGAAVLS